MANWLFNAFNKAMEGDVKLKYFEHAGDALLTADGTDDKLIKFEVNGNRLGVCGALKILWQSRARLWGSNIPKLNMAPATIKFALKHYFMKLKLKYKSFGV
eukprot:5263383-Prymnesium_polylepis.1